jgi:hypothetical protein
MHFLEEYLVFHPVQLYLIAVSLYTLNLSLYAYADRKRQKVTAISSAPALSLRHRLAATSVGASIFLIPGLFLSGDLRALFAGAFVVMQLGSLSALVAGIQTTNALLLPGAFAGQITYPRSTSAFLAAANLSALSLFSFAAFALTGSPSFFSAALYLAVTSLGYRRRARQYASKEQAEGRK